MNDGHGDLSAYSERVDYPYYIVTVRSRDAEMAGCLAGFVTQSSIHPPNFLVCISKANHTLGVAERSTSMGLHLLGEAQVDVARLFGEETGDRVAGGSAAPGRRCSSSPPSAWKATSLGTSPPATTRPFSCGECALSPASPPGS